MIEPDFTEIVALDLLSAEQKQRLVCCYRSQKANTVACAKSLSACLADLCSVAYPCTVLGDFNLPSVDWETLECRDGTKIANSEEDIKFDRLLFECFLSNSLSQYVLRPTKGDNVLDLVFCNDESCVVNVTVGSDPFIGDHRPVYFTLLSTEVPIRERETYVKDFKNADYKGIGNFMQSQNWDEKFEDCVSTNDFYIVFCETLHAAIEVFVPNKRVKNSLPFRLPRRLRKLRARKNALYNKRDNVPNGRVMYKDCCKEWYREIYDYREKMEAKCIDSDNVNRFYKFANSKLKSRQGLAHLVRVDGTLTCDDKEKSEILNTFFGSVFTRDNGRVPEFRKKVENDVSLSEIVFTPAKVQKVLKKLPNKLSRSPDGIPSLFLKNIYKNAASVDDIWSCVCVPLSKIFNVSFSSGEMPNIWLTADVVAVFKKGLSSQASNYRPISLTCICCKLMEGIVKNEVLEYLLRNNLISNHQHGFLSRRSVDTQLLECFNFYSNAVKNKQNVDIVYLDYAKAFDSVSHPKLLCKLNGYGLSGTLLRWLEAFLSNRKQRVVVNDTYSDYIPVLSGVPQGSVLGPLLFLVYINDIIECSVSDVHLKLFADDVKLYTVVSDDEKCISKLYLVLENIYWWASLWQLNISIQKCASLSVGYSNPKRVYSLNRAEISRVETFRDLGVIMTENLKMSDHCEKITASAFSRLGIIFRAFTTKNPSVLVRAFVTYVRPLLESNTTAWSPYLVKDIECVERVQRQFTLRLFRRCGLGHPGYEERCRILNLQSLESRRSRNDLVMCFKIIKGKVDLKCTDFFSFSTANNRGHRYKLFVPDYRVDVRKYFFSNRVINAWNALPNSVVNSNSVKQFKNSLEQSLST